jgi:sugar phosphate permease
MGFARQAGAAVILVTLTLWLQCAGMAVLIDLARTYIARSTKGLSAWRAAVLICRFSGVTIVLHLLQILLWATFYRWYCFPTWEASFYFSGAAIPLSAMETSFSRGFGGLWIR